MIRLFSLALFANALFTLVLAYGLGVWGYNAESWLILGMSLIQFRVGLDAWNHKLELAP